MSHPPENLDMETLERPPIREAMIDVRALLPPEITLAEVEQLSLSIQDRYPKRMGRRTWQLELQVGSAGRADSKDKGLDGFLCQTSDDRQAVQFRRDGFTFSRLHPYEGWDKAYAEARRLWRLYVERCHPQVVTRVALRFINGIEIPAQEFDLADYFTTAPQAPLGTTGVMEGFLSRVVVAYPRDDARAIITLAPAPVSPPGASRFLLDIDAFSEVKLGAEDPRMEHILHRLREIKNEIFFSSLTEKAKELFR